MVLKSSNQAVDLWFGKRAKWVGVLLYTYCLVAEGSGDTPT
jgi:hypothetical protein